MYIVCFDGYQIFMVNSNKTQFKNRSLRTYILFVAILAILYFKSLLISINYKNIKI